MSKKQSLEKMRLLHEQVVKHAQKNNLQTFSIHETEDHQVIIQGHHTKELIVNLAAHLALYHPEEVTRARNLIVSMGGQKELQQAETTPKLVVVEK